MCVLVAYVQRNTQNLIFSLLNELFNLVVEPVDIWKPIKMRTISVHQAIRWESVEERGSFDMRLHYQLLTLRGGLLQSDGMQVTDSLKRLIIRVNIENSVCAKWKRFPSCISICQLLTMWHTSPLTSWTDTRDCRRGARVQFFLEVILNYSLFKFKNSKFVLFPCLYVLFSVNDLIGYFCDGRKSCFSWCL